VNEGKNRTVKRVGTGPMETDFGTKVSGSARTGRKAGQNRVESEAGVKSIVDGNEKEASEDRNRELWCVTY
jgi:hypothetical protein